MPLLDMVGVDSCQRSFCIAFAFLSGESEEDYSWALQHLRSLYEHELPSVILTDRCLAAMNAVATPTSAALLCLWHVNKAVLQHCQPAFGLKGGQLIERPEDKAWDEFYGFWHSMVASTNEEVFEERLAKFKLRYAAKREPSGFEIVQAVKRAPSKCGKCHQVGHILTSNACPLKYSKLQATSSLAPNTALRTLVDPTKDSSPSVQVQAKPTTSENVLPPKPTPSPAVSMPTRDKSTPSLPPTTVESPGPFSPEAIYARYVAARSAWYAAQPAGSAQTDQEYRKAMKLPLKYSKASYKWCLDFKNMGKFCRTGKIIRPWTSEEVMTYLDWSNAEDARVEEVVRKDVEANGFRTRSKGPGYLWAQVERDIEEQNRLLIVEETMRVSSASNWVEGQRGATLSMNGRPGAPGYLGARAPMYPSPSRSSVRQTELHFGQNKKNKHHQTEQYPGTCGPATKGGFLVSSSARYRQPSLQAFDTLWTKMNQTTFPDDALPPEGTYESRESLLAAINSWAKPRGYAFTTGKSSKIPNGRVKVVFACDQNKLPPSTSIDRIRGTSSRRTGCKFSILAKQSLKGNSWVLSHRPDKECALHNHPPSEAASTHPAHRKLQERDITMISRLTTAGAAPRDMRTYLNNNSDTLATQRDIYIQGLRSL
ncbi:hypothetical protein MKZ38_007931 [Zalerion maritima]|uniref:MULE transposase domain-containing protein n=1 Tax=Zalerion maritima TaxID=339359 RepID=A0AAD5WN09_9PEZI|nr:hypothetical protein MKZ38_007931 [Zalerion maritima]